MSYTTQSASKQTKSARWSQRRDIWKTAAILVAAWPQAALGFSQLPTGKHHRGTTLFASTLQDRTVKELWKILEDSNQVERGLKSRLKRKQDIINYIEERDLQHDDKAMENQALEEPQDKNSNLKAAPKDANQNQGHHINGDTGQSISNGISLEGLDEEEEGVDDSIAALSDIAPNIAELIPPFVAQKMVQRGITSLLPIQVKSFQRIYSGEDAVLQAPTGSGKTLAYVLPLLSKKPKGRRKGTAAPLVLVLAPARELARQVGREFDKFSKISSATVFGGVPIERHVALLKKKPQVLVSTPGRLRELVREGQVSYEQVSTVVIDEADNMLDKADSPDVRAILEDLEEAASERGDDAEYQLLLVSATMNQHVLQFARELEIPSSALMRVSGSESKVPIGSSASKQDSRAAQAQSVQHWHMSCKTSVRPSVAMDLISIVAPLLTIVFVASKAEAESVASTFSSKLGGSVRLLHGDMKQTARSRSIALIREAAKDGDPQVLIATDVASRGIDLAVDLVVQFGVPRISGKEGTFSTDLYTHRTGRTGRVRSDGDYAKKANAIMLYDPAAGEGKLVPHLADEIKSELGIEMLPKQLPSAAEVIAAAYERTKELVSLGKGEPENSDLATYFKQVISTQPGVDTSDPEQLLEYLARAMVVLSNVDPSISPFHQHASLLSGSISDRTLRLIAMDKEALTPPEVTKTCKKLGSGKLGRVLICQDGSAVFDLPRKRAMNLLSSAASNTEVKEFQLELPLTLPDM